MLVCTRHAPAGKGNAQRNRSGSKGPRGGENRIDGDGAYFVRAVQAGSEADGTFPRDATGGGDVCEDGTGDLMREETIVRKHLS